jgi:hypothetical protein
LKLDESQIAQNCDILADIPEVSFDQFGQGRNRLRTSRSNCVQERQARFSEDTLWNRQ